MELTAAIAVAADSAAILKDLRRGCCCSSLSAPVTGLMSRPRTKMKRNQELEKRMEMKHLVKGRGFGAGAVDVGTVGDEVGKCVGKGVGRSVGRKGVGDDGVGKYVGEGVGKSVGKGVGDEVGGYAGKGVGKGAGRDPWGCWFGSWEHEWLLWMVMVVEVRPGGLSNGGWKHVSGCCSGWM